MTTFIFSNDVLTSLAGAITSTATSLTLASSAGLPTSIPSGCVLVISLRDQATRQITEIIYAGAVSGATLSSLARGQEGTSAQSWGVGDYAYSDVTAGQMGALMQASSFPSSLGSNGYKQWPDPNSPSGYFIEQWGQGTTISGAASITLTEAFPNAIEGVTITEANTTSWSPTNFSVYGTKMRTTAGFIVNSLEWNGTGFVASTGSFFWRAIGY